MEVNEKLIKEISAIAIIILFGVLIFFAIKPILFAIIWGMILAYVFMPAYNRVLSRVKNEYLAATITLIIAILLILIPLWFIIPIAVQQIFEVYKFSQGLNLDGFIGSIFPAASSAFVVQAGATLNLIIGKITSAAINSLIEITLNIPLLLVDLIIIAFVFFFTLKDSDKLKIFARSISPLSHANEDMVAKQFKDITYSTIYGRFVVGVAQGLLSGLGFLMFGVKNALLLTMLSMFLAVLPTLGVFFVWIPVAIYMFASGNIAVAIAFVLYNLIIVSNIDNVLLVYIMSKRTTLSPLFALISSIGGLFLFGLIGIVIGPLIFAYFIILVDLYRNKNLLSLFSGEEPSKELKKSKNK